MARTMVGRALNDPAEKAILDSITDPKLFQALMTNITAGGPRARRATAQLNAWLATVPDYLPGDQQQQRQQPQQDQQQGVQGAQ